MLSDQNSVHIFYFTYFSYTCSINETILYTVYRPEVQFARKYDLRGKMEYKNSTQNNNFEIFIILELW
jgi:hypothetical protein